MFELRFAICLVLVVGLMALAQATTEPLPELVSKEKRDIKSETEIEAETDVGNKNAEALLAVDAGAEHADATNREVRQFGFRRRFYGGGFRRPYYGGFRRPYYGGFRRPYYGGFYRPPFFPPPPPFFPPPPFYGPGFYG